MNSSGMGLAEQIKDLALYSKDWRHYAMASVAYKLYDRVNAVCFGSNLPQAVIGFDDSGRIQKDGEYYFEGDDVSLPHHIDLAKGLSVPGMIVALIHNMEHLNSEVFSVKKTWYHSNSWRKSMAGHGLTAKPNGDVVKFDAMWLEDTYLQILEGTGIVPHDYTTLTAWSEEYVKTGEVGIAEALAAIVPVEETDGVYILEDIGYDADAAKELEEWNQSGTFPNKKSKKKTQKFACACNGDKNGSTTFWAVRVAPGSVCGACGSEFLPTDIFAKNPVV